MRSGKFRQGAALKLLVKVKFAGHFSIDVICAGEAPATDRCGAVVRMGSRLAPVSPFSLHSPAEVVQPAPSVNANSLNSADTPLSRWFSEQLAEVAASARLDQQGAQAVPQSCHQQYLQQLPRSLSSKQFSAHYGRWADTVIEDMMAAPSSMPDRSYSSSIKCAHIPCGTSYASSCFDEARLMPCAQSGVAPA